MKIEDRPSFIYALRDPVSGEIRYIGKSTNPIKRLRTHIEQSHQKNTHKECWIIGLLNIGLKPDIEILEIVSAFSDWEAREKWWIAEGRDLGWRLTNTTDGGDGGATTKGKSSWNAGKHGIFSEDALRRISEANKGKKSLETRQRMSEACKRREKTPGLIAAQQKASNARKGQAPWNKGKFGITLGPQTTEHKKKISDGRKAYWIRWRIEHNRLPMNNEKDT